MADDKIFADGFIFKQKDNDPDFVLGHLSIKVDDAIVFLKENEKKGWVNLDLKRAKSGKTYLELDTWEPKAQEGATIEPKEKAKAKSKKPLPSQAPKETEEDDLPF